MKVIRKQDKDAVYERIYDAIAIYDVYHRDLIACSALTVKKNESGLARETV